MSGLRSTDHWVSGTWTLRNPRDVIASGSDGRSSKYKAGDTVRILTEDELISKGASLSERGDIRMKDGNNFIISSDRQYCGTTGKIRGFSELYQGVFIQNDAGSFPFWAIEPVSISHSPSSPMAKFKVGDRVLVRSWSYLEREFGTDEDGDIRIPGCSFLTSMKKYCGTGKTVTRVDSDGDCRLDNNDTDWFSRYSLTLISHSPSSPMESVKAFLKRAALSADDRALRDAGLVDDCNNLTQDGLDALEHLNREAQKEALVKIAKDIVAEKKAQKKDKK